MAFNYIKHLLIVLISVTAVPTISYAQLFGNEWINFNQQYYKIPVAKKGIYRLGFNDLAVAGVPVQSIDPRRIQIFHRGKEQAIYIRGQEDARFDLDDYIEFYGQINDGTLDKKLYQPEGAQPHAYASLYSDTTAYFLTWKLNNETGKRMASFSEVNTSNIPAENYHIDEDMMLFAEEYSGGKVYPEGVISAETWHSHFDFGEGWTGSRIGKGTGRSFLFSGLTEVYTVGPDPSLEVLLVGRNHRPHNVNILIGPSETSLRQVANLKFNYYNNEKISIEARWSDISPTGNLIVRVFVEGAPDIPADQVSVSYLKLQVPEKITMKGTSLKIFNLNSSALGKSYLEIEDGEAGSLVWDISDEANVKRIGTSFVGGTISCIVPETTRPKKIMVQKGFYTPRLKKVKMRSINAAAHNYMIISHKILMKEAGGHDNAVKAYAAYRASQAGGGYDTLLVDIDQVYDQFHYGEVSPLAIKKFAHFMLANGAPQYLFLVGKSLTVNQGYYRENRLTATHHDLVPTGGWPGSDNILTAGLPGSTGYEAAIPTGRLNVSSPVDVINYLNKVKEAEQFQFNDLWKKRIVHLSGGQTARELISFRNYLSGFKSIAEGFYFGGNVTTVGKKTNNAVEMINVSEEVNKGVSMLTFFGHSGATVVDIEIGFVSYDMLGYNNRGKYPLIVVNGCDAGNIFTKTYTFGEDWIRTANRGAIATLAHAGIGFESELRRNTEVLYRNAFGDSVTIKKTLGEVLKKSHIDFINGVTMNHARVSQVQQFVLQGDPAVNIFGAQKTDYSIRPEDLTVSSFDNSSINVLTDSFKIDIIVKNYGLAFPDSMWVSVKRHLTDGRTIDYDPVKYPPIKFQDTISYTIFNHPGTPVFGNNRFEVTVNAGNVIPELNYHNNKASIEYMLPTAGTFNLKPVNFSIVNDRSVQLVSQSSNLFDDDRDFIFQIDTSPDFKSNQKRERVVSGKVISKWNIDLFQNIGLRDSTVFYWRTKFLQPKQGEDTAWSRSSFVYIGNVGSGWSQSSFHQLGKGEIVGMERDEVQKEWNFKDMENAFRITTYGRNNPDYNKVELFINEVSYIYSSGFEEHSRLCTSNSINAVAFDRATLSPYLVMPYSGFSILQRTSCGRVPQVINNFLKNEIENDLLLNQYLDLLKEGDYILMFSLGTVTYETWPASLKQKMKEVGVSEPTINQLKTNDPFIVFGKKGLAPGEAIVIIADNLSSLPSDEQQISLEELVKGKVSKASVFSPRIGPASQWKYVHSLVKKDDTDNVQLDIIGVGNNGVERVLFEDADKDFDISGIDAKAYPYLRLKFIVEDSENYTPAQLKRWQVLYTGVPEGIASYKSNGGVDRPFQKMEGESFQLEFGFENISDIDFNDSLTVQYTYFNETQRETFTGSLKISALKAGNIDTFTIPVSTEEKTGTNNFTVNVNPGIQPELYYHNNILFFPGFMKVEKDETHPVLDVSVDGRYIMDGEIVSPNPMISVKLKDENKILLKKDTTDVEIYLKAGCTTCMFQRINLSSPNVRWTPATEEEPFSIEYQPDALEDDIYTLRVQAVDGSGNKSGTEPFMVRFEVINQSSITHFYPYPNPFSSNTRFVFTLTGAEVPDELKIQIMTVTGRIVREITQDEIGPIRIGNNISQYAWDGKDEFGDQLANGVYLYKVLVRLGGKDIDRRETSADRAFKKNFGKLYILR